LFLARDKVDKAILNTAGVELNVQSQILSLKSFELLTTKLKGNGVATLAQNKIFPAKQELLLSEITGIPLDAQMQRNRLDVDERVEGSRQCSCSRPS
jgi:hypothetical protein